MTKFGKVFLGVFLALSFGSTVATLAQSSTLGVSVEAESGISTGGASVISDSASSAGNHVVFANLTPPQNGIFTDTFDSFVNWSFSHWTYAIETDRTNDQSSATIDGGKVKIVNHDQNYGEATVRSHVKYDLSQGGTVKFDVSLASGNIPSSSTDPGWPWIGFLTQPYIAPSTPCCNGGAPTPKNGVYVRFVKTTVLPWTPPLVLNYSNHIESNIEAAGNAINTVTLVDGKLNRVELRYSPGRMEIWASDASLDGANFGPLKHIQDYSVNIPPTGYIYLGSHNHASIKYSVPIVNSVDAWFDNISYPAGTITRTYPNGQGVNKEGMTSARVIFNAAYDPAQNAPSSAAVIVNGHSYPFTENSVGSQTVLGSVLISMSDIINGNNTIVIQGFSEVSFVNLVVE